MFGESPASWVCGSICAFSLPTQSQSLFSHSMAQAGSGARSSRVRPLSPVLASFRGADSGGRSSPSPPQVHTRRGVHSPIHALARRTNEKRTDWRERLREGGGGLEPRRTSRSYPWNDSYAAHMGRRWWLDCALRCRTHRLAELASFLRVAHLRAWRSERIGFRSS